MYREHDNNSLLIASHFALIITFGGINNLRLLWWHKASKLHTVSENNGYELNKSSNNKLCHRVDVMFYDVT